MENETKEVINSTNDTETTENTEDTTEAKADEVDVEALKKENATLKAQKDHWKKKATSTTETKTEGKETKTEGVLSQKDFIALAKADIEDEDIDEVVEYATFKKISVSEALKSNMIKTLLSEKAEARKVANATNTGTTRKASSQASDDSLTSNFKKGQLPDKDEDIERLIKARKNIK